MVHGDEGLAGPWAAKAEPGAKLTVMCWKRFVPAEDDAFNAMVAASRITVSTSGIPDAIRRMADEGQRVKLALSLHALTNGMRSELMPINRRYDLAAMIPRLGWAAVRTPPMPYRLLKLAEVYW